MKDVSVSYLLVSFVDMFGYGGEVCVELADRFHNGGPIWSVLEKSKHIRTVRRRFGGGREHVLVLA